MARLLCLVTFYSSIMVSIDSVDVDRVGPMNELLSNGGWLKLDTGNAPLRVIEQWMETREHGYIRQLLALNADGLIVTEDNADFKIRQTHQFLSCKYADDLMKYLLLYCEYEGGIVHQCSELGRSSEVLKEFETFVKDLIQDNNRLVTRMRGALMCLHELSPKTVHNKDVFHIMEDFLNYYNAKQYEATTSATGSAIKARISAIETHMFTTIELLSAFFKSNCSSVPEYVDENDYEHDRVSWTRRSVEAMTNKNSFGSAMDRMQIEVEKKVDIFIKSHYELLGFEYVPESGTTRIDYDPETIPRVNKMNDLLSFTGWSEMVTDEIFENRENMRFKMSVRDVLKKSQDGTVVNKKNLGEKIRQVHQMLSCEYIIVMKTCHDHLLGIADECSRQDTADCWKHFWVIVKQVDPMVLHMRGSLSHFYRLFPQNEYIKGVYEILGELKNYYDSFDLSDSWLSKTTNYLVMKLRKMESLTEKIDPLYKYFGQHCRTRSPYFYRDPPNDPELPLPRRQDEFNEFINRFVGATFRSFGFTYNGESDTTDVLKNESSDDE